MNLNNYYISECRDEDGDYYLLLRYGERNGVGGYIARAILRIDRDGDVRANRWHFEDGEWRCSEGAPRYYKSANKARKNEYKHLQKLGKKHYNAELKRQRNAAELVAAAMEAQ